MINLVAARRADRMSRRAALRFGLLGAAGLTLPGMLRSGAAAAATGGRAKNCIYIFLCGGPSHLDLWDLKPDAPEGIRGVFQPIRTSVPGIHIGELLPQIARHADKFAIVRSMMHTDSGHEGGIVRTLLGQNHPRPGDFYISRHDHPGIGSILHCLAGDCGAVPPWVILPRPFTTSSPPYKGQSAGFLGPAYDPIVMDEPKRDSLAPKELKLQDLELSEGVDDARLGARRRLLERATTSSIRRHAAPLEADAIYEKAYAMLASGAARRAFDLTREPDAVRDRYGRNEYGQSFLLARRLVEAGVRIVNVFWTYFDAKGCQFNLWDNHGVTMDVCGTGGARTGLEMLRHRYCCPSFDVAFSALLEDLHQCGLLDETLVAVAGEFGRTPKINATSGRDHWPHCYSQLLAGAGVRGGQVYGASDKHGAYVKDLPVTPADFAATILHAFGITPETPIFDQLQRPVRVSEGMPVTALF